MQREWLRGEAIDGVIDRFAWEYVQAERDAARDRLRVTLNLHDAAMSPAEATFLLMVLNEFRVERT